MCWRPIGGKVCRTHGPSWPLAWALPPRTERTIPTIAATAMITTPSATNQRFKRRGPPDSTRRCGPAALCCGLWLVRGGGGARLVFVFGATHKKVSSSGARLCTEEARDGLELGHDGGGRERLEEAPPVRPRAQARVEYRNDALVRMTSDQAPDALPELQHRRRERVLYEPVSPLPCDALAAPLDERIPGPGERKLVDHEE